MMSNDSIINVETKNNRVNKMKKLHLKRLYLYYNIIYLPAVIVKEILRWWGMTES